MPLHRALVECAGRSGDMPQAMDSCTARRLRVLVLYDGLALATNTVRDHLNSLRLFSRHDVQYAHAAHGEPLRFSLSAFDAVIVHYSLRLAIPGHISRPVFDALERYEGVKVAFLQDEYDNTWFASQCIGLLGFDVVYSCVPPTHVKTVYARVPPHVEICHNLSGYAPLELDPARPLWPLHLRPIFIAYPPPALPS